MRNSGSSCSESVGPPLWLLAELTYRCPLQCPYCSNPLEFAREGAELSTAEWIEVFRQARELGAAQLGFSGGEPLLRQDLAELIEAGRGPMSSTLEIIHKYHIISAQISAWEKPF